MPLVTTATFFPPPAANILDPSPLATLIMPLSSSHALRREFECVLITVLGDSIANDNQRIADRARYGEHFEIRLGKIAEIVEIVHLVLNKKECVFGIIGRR